MTPRSEARLPPQVAFIIGNEACERFSFYGMRSILTVFLVDSLLKADIVSDTQRAAEAKSLFHLFVFGVYFFPLLGGFLADRLLGKYRTILWLSVVYCLGHLCLSAFESWREGFLFGLFLIALGSGGIKPCVSALVGDQFNESTKSQARLVFAAFYWSINLGSLFASLFIPKLLKSAGPAVAFGVPGVLMVVATLIFWAGRRLYVDPPPTPADGHGFASVVWTALRRGGLQAAQAVHPAEAVAAARSVLKVLLVFAPIPFFWALFDQKASTWVLQAKGMDPNVQLGPLSYVFEPSQMQFINPLLVMILIPLLNVVGYPLLERAGLVLRPLTRMTLGMFIAVLSWVAAGAVQQALDGGAHLSILWQLGPYALLTLAEVLVSTTGLEFAYSQAPPSMKGTLMSFWNLTVAVANLGVSRLALLVTLQGAWLFYFWAFAALLAAVALAVIARGYVMKDQFRPA